MKKYIVLFAIFLAGIFFYPVIAHADKIEAYFAINPLSAPVVLVIVGSMLLTAASLSKRLVKQEHR